MINTNDIQIQKNNSNFLITFSCGKYHIYQIPFNFQYPLPHYKTTLTKTNTLSDAVKAVEDCFCY